MTPLDLDQLRTFVAIADTGSFTKAASRVAKTQSAVSMQMRKLEERLNRPLFYREGRNSRLTDDGDRLLAYARRMLSLSDEAISAFDDQEIAGHVKLGTPDDYADRFLPEILMRFSQTHPRAELTVVCEPTGNLVHCIESDAMDLAIITHEQALNNAGATIIRHEPIHWVVSSRHPLEKESPLPLALGRATCMWRNDALDALAAAGLPNRILYQSFNSSAVAAAILSGLAISVLPESALRPGMRILTEEEGFPRLPACQIGLVKNQRSKSPVVDALATHIRVSLDNMSIPQAAE